MAKKTKSKSHTTTDQDEIRQWVEERGGEPAVVEGTEILRINYPGYSGDETLQVIAWDEFFRIFDDSNLAFLMQETTASGGQSRFSKFVDRGNLKSGGRGKKAA